MISQNDEVHLSLARISDLIKKGNFNEAIKSFNSLETRYPKDKIINFAKVGLLIELGLGLNKENVVVDGIELGNELLKEISDKQFLSHLHYNIANGHMTLYSLSRDSKTPLENIPNNVRLQMAKFHFRESIKNIVHGDNDLELQLWTNYGNCLDALGRNIEAISCYDNALKIDSKFAMAIGNKAKAMKFFADISGAYRKAIYLETYQMLKAAIALNNLIKYGGEKAKKSFEAEILKIESLFMDRKSLSKKLRHRKYKKAYLTDFEKYYLFFCSKYRLFLNAHIHAADCEASINDPIFIRLITPLKENKRFNILARQINQIKEDYAVARLLLVQSQFRRKDLNRISKRTLFAYLSDYCFFNLYMGLLKCAFKEAFDTLDKITVFVNDYYNLGIDPKRINFDRKEFWQKENKIRDEFSKQQNISLFALYDIFLDFKNGFNKGLNDIRNALTHRKIVLCEAMADFGKNGDNSKISYDAMLSETINLFQLVKSAIIYLINFVEIEERKKERNAKKDIFPIFIDDSQFLEE